MGDRDMPRGGRHRDRKDLEPVAEQQHAGGGVGRKFFVEHLDCAGDRAGHRLAGVVGKDWQPRRNRQAVGLDLPHRRAEPGAQMRAGHNQPQRQRLARRQLLQHRPQKPILRPRRGHHG